MQIGAQLFSARNYLKDEAGIDAAFRKAKEAGYECVQYSGAPDGGDFCPETLKKIIDKYEMPVKLTHIAFERLRDQTQNEIKKHLAIGCKNIGLGMMPRECLFDMDKLNKFIGDVRVIIDKLGEKGCKFFYHNHHIEFYKLPIGVTVFDYLLAKLPDLNITLDTHWVQRGGADVVDTIKKCAGRLECVHLKDYIINDKLEPAFAAVGEGNMNWSKILPAFEAAGTRYAFVEQDDALDLGEPFDYLKISRDNLKSMRY